MIGIAAICVVGTLLAVFVLLDVANMLGVELFPVKRREFREIKREIAELERERDAYKRLQMLQERKEYLETQINELKPKDEGVDPSAESYESIRKRNDIIGMLNGRFKYAETEQAQKIGGYDFDQYGNPVLKGGLKCAIEDTTNEGGIEFYRLSGIQRRVVMRIMEGMKEDTGSYFGGRVDVFIKNPRHFYHEILGEWSYLELKSEEIQ